MSKKESNPKPLGIESKPTIPPTPPVDIYRMARIRLKAVETVDSTDVYYYFDSDDLADTINALIKEGRIRL